MKKDTKIIILCLVIGLAGALGLRSLATAQTPREYGCVEQEHVISDVDGEGYLYTYVWLGDSIVNCERDKASEAMEEPRRVEGLEILKAVKDGRE
jgi:hypothetical protein